MQSTSHRALLVLDLQKEFLHPPTGRCLLPSASSDVAKQPAFLTNIRALLPRFRALGGDVIWMRSESLTRRDHAEETILIVNESDDEASTSQDSATSGGEPPKRASRTARFIKAGRVGGTGPSRPPLLTDAYLSIDTSHPPVSKNTPASEWHEPVRSMMTIPLDREMTKTWYSAFKDTELLQTLRGRIVTRLVIIGLMTNVDVLATAADAVRHGLEVWVLEDCLGYRNESAHNLALKDMENDFAVERTNSEELMKVWEKEKRKRETIQNAGGLSRVGLGATGMSKEELTKVVEGLRAMPTVVDGPARGRLAQKVTQRTSQQPPPARATETNGTSAAATKKRAENTSLQDTAEVRNAGEKAPPPQDTTATLESVEKAPPKQSDKDGKQVVNVISPSPPISEVQEKGKPPFPTPKEAKQTQQRVKAERNPRKFESTAPVLGESDKIGEGDSFIVYNLLPTEQAQMVFEKIKKEVQWRSMFHRGGEVPRLVAVEGEVREDGSFPIYRHPVDESPPLLPFSPIVNLIRKEVQMVLKHPINHVLIQHYRDGSDYISEHSDKTLDIARGSKIVNVSLGAQRTMILRVKKDPKAPKQSNRDEDASIDRGGVAGSPDNAGVRRDMQRIPMPHNSMFVLGLETNKKWLHGIRQDKRAPNIKSPVELAYNGERISLTFRHIATWLSRDEQEICGQGAPGKTADVAQPVINGDSASTEKLLEAFGAENQLLNFDWDTYYGPGFNVLHFQEPRPRILTSGALDVPTARIKICLREMKTDFVEQKILPQQMPSLLSYNARGEPPIFVDTDRERTAISDSLAILQYLEMFRPPPTKEGPWLLPSPKQERAKYALALTRLQEADKLLGTCLRGVKDEVESELKIWDTHLRKSPYATGDEFSLVDIAIYPVLKRIEQEGHSLSSELVRYMSTQAERPSICCTYSEAEEARIEAEVLMVPTKQPSRKVSKQATSVGDGSLAGLESELAKVTIKDDDALL